jgi:5-methylcytosine-specific restriction enzyme A
MPTRAPMHRAPGQRERVAWDHRASSTARGYGASWRRVRADVLNSEPLCRACASEGRTTAATTVDHITPKAQGGGDDYANLQPLCAPCHAAKSAREGGATPRPRGAQG